MKRSLQVLAARKSPKLLPLFPATLAAGTLKVATWVKSGKFMKTMRLLTAAMLTLSLATLGHAAPDETPNRAPDFVLDRAAQVTSMLPQNPWSGPVDLSARAWLWREGAGEKRTLVLRIEVSDDVWVQPFVGDDAWQGDGIQVAFSAFAAKDWWEVGLSKSPAANATGDAAAHVFRAVPDVPNPWRDVQLSITPREGGLIYQARFPLKAFGLSDQLLESGLRFSFLVNDRDDASE